MNKLLTALIITLALVIAVAIASPGQSRAAGAHADRKCVAPLHLLHPTSLAQLSRQVHVSPARELALAAFCWDGTWTPNLRRLITGQLGPDIMTAKLPVGSRFWLPALRR